MQSFLPEIVGPLKFREPFTAGSNGVSLSSPANLTSDVALVLPTSSPPVNGSMLVGNTDGSLLFTTTVPAHSHSLSGSEITGILPISKGGTGETSASAAINALLPSQVGQTGKFLTSNGSVASWAAVSGGGTGTVTSVHVTMPTSEFNVTGSPITGAGTIAIAWDIQPIFTVLMGQSSGPPLFQAITIDSLPVITIAKGGTGQSSRNAAINALLPPQAGANGLVLKSDGTNASWQTDNTAAGGGGGTVTSVGMTVPTGLSVTPSQITSSGIFAVSWGSTTAYDVLAANAFGTVGFAPLTSTHLPLVPLGKGGTGQTSANAALNALLPSQTGNSTKVLQTDGSNTSWQTVSGGGGGIVNVSGQSSFGNSSFTQLTTGYQIINDNNLEVVLTTAGKYFISAVIFMNWQGNPGSQAVQLSAAFTKNGSTDNTTMRYINRNPGHYESHWALPLQAIVVVSASDLTGGQCTINVVAADALASTPPSPATSVVWHSNWITYIKLE